MTLNESLPAHLSLFYTGESSALVSEAASSSRTICCHLTWTNGAGRTMGRAWDHTNNRSPLAQLYCSGCDQPNKASTADFNHYLIVIFASQCREMGTIFSTLHLIDTASPFVFCFQLQAIKAFLASHNNCIKRPLHNHTITLFIALPSSVSFIWLQSPPAPKKC